MNWLKALFDATSLDRLLAIVNEYLLAFPEEHWSWIPREARPRLVATADELHEWHRRLSEAMAAATSPNIRLQDLCVFFVRASARALELQERGARCSNDGDQDGDSREAG